MLCSVQGNDIYIRDIYTPNLGLAITVSVREGEQDHFRGSTEGSTGGNGSKEEPQLAFSDCPGHRQKANSRGRLMEVL